MNNRIKVLLVPCPPPSGKIGSGVDRYLDALNRTMNSDVQYLGLDDPQNIRESIVAEAAPTSKASRPRFRLIHLLPRNITLLMGYARDAWRFSRLLRAYRDQVDLIHVNRVGCEVQSIAAKLAGFKRIVTTIHNLPGDAEKDNWVCRLVEWLSFKCGDVHIAVSEATFEAWRERVGLRKKEGSFEQKHAKDAKEKGLVSAGGGKETYSLRSSRASVQTSSSDRGGKCVVIYNGMDPEDLAGFDRRAYRGQFCEDPDHAFIIGICARLHRMKGHVVLLEAFAKLLDERGIQNPESRIQNNDERVPSPVTRYPSLLLLIAGSGTEEARIKAKISELGLEAHVRLLGHRSDAERFAASLDLNVLPSVALECLPYSLVEAMFQGVPSVVSDVGGMKELIHASGGGRVVPAGDVGALAEAMLTFVKDPALRAQAGCHALEYAKRELTAAKITKLTAGVYVGFFEK
jgi:glycosyltransferase involved in cell wall biosynthesis